MSETSQGAGWWLDRPVRLNLDPGFMDAYMMAMFLPNGDGSLFPSVK